MCSLRRMFLHIICYNCTLHGNVSFYQSAVIKPTSFTLRTIDMPSFYERCYYFLMNTLYWRELYHIKYPKCCYWYSFQHKLLRYFSYTASIYWSLEWLKGIFNVVIFKEFQVYSWMSFCIKQTIKLYRKRF